MDSGAVTPLDDTDERRLISSGTWTSPAARAAAAKVRSVTFGEYAAAWLVGRKVRGRPLADRTRDGYQDLLDAHILPAFDPVPSKAITPEMVDHWYELCAVGRPTRQARAYSLLRTILGTAVDRNLIQVANPAKICGGGSAERAKKVRPATLTELETLAAAMPDKNRLMVMRASWCALRFSELAELRGSDVDLKTGVVRVRRGVIRTRVSDDEGGRRMVAKVKTPKSDAGSTTSPSHPPLAGPPRRTRPRRVVVPRCRRRPPRPVLAVRQGQRHQQTG